MKFLGQCSNPDSNQLFILIFFFYCWRFSFLPPRAWRPFFILSGSTEWNRCCIWSFFILSVSHGVKAMLCMKLLSQLSCFDMKLQSLWNCLDDFQSLGGTALWRRLVLWSLITHLILAWYATTFMYCLYPPIIN